VADSEGAIDGADRVLLLTDGSAPNIDLTGEIRPLPDLLHAHLSDAVTVCRQENRSNEHEGRLREPALERQRREAGGGSRVAERNEDDQETEDEDSAHHLFDGIAAPAVPWFVRSSCRSDCEIAG
jgi:hypothetical protein